MSDADDVKATFHMYLQRARDAVVWKLDDLSEYDARRPLVPTGTNLLGLVKHLATVEMGYFGDVFGRPFPDAPPWATSDDNADLWATASQSRPEIVDLYRRACTHADATISAVGLSDRGLVPWWPPERREPTLHRVLVHVTAETHRHAGHADIARELVDGSAGVAREFSNLQQPADDWRAHYERVDAAAREADKSRGGG